MYSKDVTGALIAFSTPERAKVNAWFFKTGKGQYGYGDKFLGVTVPQQRKVAKQFKSLPLNDVEKLIKSPCHEERLTGLFILVGQYEKGDEKTKKEVYEFYMSHTKWVNNWDLVDSSAHKIVGPWLENKPEKTEVLTKLAKSDLLWERRIAILSTFHYIGQGRSEEAIKIANILLYDEHDLIQKAVGWMLREVGKKVNEEVLTDFLEKSATTMPRMTLRYAIERLSPEKQQYYLKKV